MINQSIFFSRRLYLIIISGLLFVLTSCGNETLDDYSDSSFDLTNQNGETVTFPEDFEGAPLVMGFIYTNCPDICSFITAKEERYIWEVCYKYCCFLI